MFGVSGTGMVPDPNRRFRLQTADLVVANKKAWALYHDFELLRNFIFNTSENTQRQHEALYAANEIINAFKPGDDKSIEEGLRIASEWLSKRGGEGQHHITAIGNCHIGKFLSFSFLELPFYAKNSCSMIFSSFFPFRARHRLALAFCGDQA